MKRDPEFDKPPRPPRLPRPMPDAGKEGWWIAPGYDPRTVRYYDGEDWTEFIARIGLRGPGEIQRAPIPPREDLSLSPDPEIRLLPTPPRHPTTLGEGQSYREGWFVNYFGDEKTVARYLRDGDITEFACEVIKDGVGAVHRRPHPKLG